jgi:hypothetical protein
VRNEYRIRWEQEIRRTKKLFKPNDLLRRAVANEDFVDSAIVGGTAVADIIAGKISESQIPQDVLDAFHAQYPQNGSFVESVQHLGGNPAQLRGLISGVKGKLFELDYVHWLNSGQLPASQLAEIATHANNPDWDVVIKDAHGHVNELLQLKATETLDYVRQAIEAHPDIDVVVPHELYEKLGDHPELISHVIDGHQNLTELNDHVADAAGHADEAALHFHLPIIAIGFAIGQNFVRYRQRRVTLAEAVRNATERGAVSVIAVGAGWAFNFLAHEPTMGAAISFTTRLFGRQVFHNLHRREDLERSLEALRESRITITKQLRRPVLELADDSPILEF